MSTIHRTLRRTSLPILLVLCLAALSVSYAFADDAQRPLATEVIGDPDAAVTGKLAVGTATPGNKALTVVGVIDFLGAGTVHNFFTQGAGNNLQINTNVDEANTVGDATKSQWKLVMGSSLDWYSIRRSPAGATYNEDALFFIEGSTGRVGIATVDTNNGGAIPFTPGARLDVRTASGDAVWGDTAATTGYTYGVVGASHSPDGSGVLGWGLASAGTAYGVYGRSNSTSGIGVFGFAAATSGTNYGVYGRSYSPSGAGVYGLTDQSTGVGVLGDSQGTAGYNYGVIGRSASTQGVGVHGHAFSTTGNANGVWGRSDSSAGTGVVGWAAATSGDTNGVYGQSDSPSGHGVYGAAIAQSGVNYGVRGRSDSPSGRGVYGHAAAITGVNYGVYGQSDSPTGFGVYGLATATDVEPGTLASGVYGVALTDYATGVYGYNLGSTGYAYGVVGKSVSTLGGAGVVGLATATTGTAKGVHGAAWAPEGVGVFGEGGGTGVVGSASSTGVRGNALGTSGVNYGIYGATWSSSGYGVYYSGGLAGTGMKSAIVETDDFGWRHLYAMESPQNWFEDFGRATLSAGETIVSIEEIFAQTVNLDEPYHLFLTPLGSGCTLYVVDMSSTSFTVRANEGAVCEIDFDYRIIAPRLDYEDLRLKEAGDPEAVAAAMPEALPAHAAQ